MDELITTIRKAAYIFGHGSDSVDNAIAVVRQIDRQGYLTHEELMQLSEYIPGTYKIVAAYLEVEPKVLKELVTGKPGISSADAILFINTAINRRYPEIANVDLGPSESEWGNVIGQFGPMAAWISRKLKWLQR